MDSSLAVPGAEPGPPSFVYPQHEDSRALPKWQSPFMGTGQGDPPAGFNTSGDLKLGTDTVHATYKSITGEPGASIPVQHEPASGKTNVAEHCASDKEKTVDSMERERLSGEAQQLIDEINAKRKQDAQMLEDYKKAMQAHVETSFTTLQGHLFQLYEQQSDEMQTKIAEVYASLERIAKIEVELQQFKNMLGMLYQDMSQS